MANMFLIYGHGGCYNHGGEALTQCGIEVLREHFPGCHITLSSHFPEQDLEFGLPADEIVARDETYLVYEKESDYSIENNDKIYKSTIERITPETVCIHLGGDNYCYPNWKRYANIHYRAIEKGARSILWSCSIDPDAIDVEMFKALRTHHLITAREDITYQALIERGIQQVVKVSDMAFRLAPSPIPFDLTNYVSITFGPLAAKKEKNSGMTLRSFQKLVNYILTSTDMNIALVPHVIMKTDNDYEMMAQLDICDTQRVRLIAEHFSAAQLKHIIGRARFAVTLRTHASIASYSSCVPTLVIGYSMKSAGIAKDLGVSEHVLQVNELQNDTDIIAAFKRLVSSEHSIKKRLSLIIPEYVLNSVNTKSLDFWGDNFGQNLYTNNRL